MAVYVDKLAIPYGRMKMCHMLADTTAELHAMADKIGLKREWFQDDRTPHYDICQAKRKRAILEGAIECDRHKVVELIKKYRNCTHTNIHLGPSVPYYEGGTCPTQVCKACGSWRFYTAGVGGWQRGKSNE